LAERRWGGLGVAACRLVGLGPGLTPSGDDFLIGVCGALALVGALAPSVAEDCRAAARVIAASAPGRTTLLSLTWLRQAAAGEFSAELGGLLAALVTAGDDAALERAAERLLAIGGTSGWDMAVGVLLGGQAMARLIPERGAPARQGAYRPPAP
ncbi:MAG: DUF2877 domain-containing protein, partial [Thermomicrobiaceae bacterium]|nr:DUF2877 domain-containing protein [Thermomicrobiaceae bacterium]